MTEKTQEFTEKQPQEKKPEEKKEEPLDPLSLLNQELADCKDKYLRQLAESENMRKRLQKEKQESIQYALGNLLAEFLGPLDHMENALKHTQHMSDEVKHWGLGFQMILTQFKDVLNANGVTAIEAKGKVFDPLVHDALETVDTDEVPEGTIVEVCSKGYKLGERIIRPPRVKVAKKNSSKKE